MITSALNGTELDERTNEFYIGTANGKSYFSRISTCISFIPPIIDNSSTMSKGRQLDVSDIDLIF